MNLTKEQLDTAEGVLRDLDETKIALARQMAAAVASLQGAHPGWRGPRKYMTGMAELIGTYHRIDKGRLVIENELLGRDLGPSKVPAHLEGWTWCHYEEDDCPQIQRLDNPSEALPCLEDEPTFDCDEAATRFVQDQAAKNPDGYHAQVLAYLFTQEKDNDETQT